jgi:small subunit ribosomal protein S5
VLTKRLGSSNPHNLVRATLDALAELRDREDIVRMRGVPTDKVAAPAT